MSGPAVGDLAPDFELRDQHGQRVSLASFRGHRTVLLVFHPSTFSPVCNSELRTLQRRWADLDRDDLQLLAVSCDPMFTQRAFADQESVRFPLLSDFWPHGLVSQEYGVFDTDFGCSRRSTFLVDRAGVVRWLVHHPMPEARSVDDYLAAVEGLANRSL